MDNNKCVQCGKKTSNPKFCSRSCAAKYNNKKYPKRKPEQKCERCGTSILSRKRYCDDCKDLITREKAKASQGVVDIKLPDGKVVERKIPDVGWSLILEIKTKYEEFKSCGELIDTIIGVCLSGIKYIREEDKKRYISLLESFRNFVYEKQTVDRVPFNRLVYALRDWVQDCCNANHHPLMSSYALDTVTLIENLLYGDLIEMEENQWGHLEPLVSMPHSSYFMTINTIFDSMFKKDMTARYVGGLIVSGKVPEGCKIVDSNQAAIVDENCFFCFMLRRCHLSSGNANELVTMQACEPKQSHGFIEDDFMFYGVILKDIEKDSYSWELTPCLTEKMCNDIYSASLGYGNKLYIPARWFTHAYEWIHEKDEYVAKPVPQWE